MLIFKGLFPGGSDVKASACNAGDVGLIPGSRRSPGEGNGNPLQYSCLENPMDRGAWQATVHGVAKSRTWLSDFTSLIFNFISEVLSCSFVWKVFFHLLICLILCVCICVLDILGFPGYSDGKESSCQCRRPRFNPWIRQIPWRREWQPTPVFLSGKFHGQRILMRYSPCGHKASDTIEWLTLSLFTRCISYIFQT